MIRLRLRAERRASARRPQPRRSPHGPFALLLCASSTMASSNRKQLLPALLLQSKQPPSSAVTRRAPALPGFFSRVGLLIVPNQPGQGIRRYHASRCPTVFRLGASAFHELGRVST